nr:immunoglobulin heavy chain junction region [Mus musculus]
CARTPVDYYAMDYW